MNTQNDLRLDFCKILCQLRRGANEQQQSSIRLIYENTISLFKDSLNIPTVMPTSLEIYSFFNFLKEMQKSHKTVALKSFFIKTKVFLIWLISVYEFFIQQSLEKFVNFTVVISVKLVLKEKRRLGNFGFFPQYRLA